MFYWKRIRKRVLPAIHRLNSQNFEIFYPSFTQFLIVEKHQLQKSFTVIPIFRIENRLPNFCVGKVVGGKSPEVRYNKNSFLNGNEFQQSVLRGFMAIQNTDLAITFLPVC